MQKIPPAIEKNLYDNRRDLWAVTRVLIHAPQYREPMWEICDLADKALLTELGREAEEYWAEMKKLYGGDK